MLIAYCRALVGSQEARKQCGSRQATGTKLRLDRSGNAHHRMVSTAPLVPPTRRGPRSSASVRDLTVRSTADDAARLSRECAACGQMKTHQDNAEHKDKNGVKCFTSAEIISEPTLQTCYKYRIILVIVHPVYHAEHACFIPEPHLQ